MLRSLVRFQLAPPSSARHSVRAVLGSGQARGRKPRSPVQTVAVTGPVPPLRMFRTRAPSAWFACGSPARAFHSGAATSAATRLGTAAVRTEGRPRWRACNACRPSIRVDLAEGRGSCAGFGRVDLRRDARPPVRRAHRRHRRRRHARGDRSRPWESTLKGGTRPFLADLRETSANQVVNGDSRRRCRRAGDSPVFLHVEVGMTS